LLIGASRSRPCAAHLSLHDLGHAAQHAVARGVPVRVVEPLEVVDVHDDDREPVVEAVGSLDLLLEPRVE
jgi:hypothetical protein